MKIIFYASRENEAGKKVKRFIDMLAPGEQNEIFQSIEQLSSGLRQPLNAKFIGVFLAGDRRELTDLLSIRHLLRNNRIILVLPDREKETVSKGHALGPRFISYADGNLSDVGVVMSKMLGNS